VIEHDGGLRVKGMTLWLDATRARDWSFISHAHSDHAVRHRRIIASPQTARIYAHRLGPTSVETPAYHAPFQVEGATCRLLPAGHILGSSQILIEHEGKRITYTGDCRVREGLTAEPIAVEPCDVLVMECTFGRPLYVFPEPAEVARMICRFIEATWDGGRTPVLLAYALGKSQEAMKLLGDRGYECVVAEPIYRIAQIYEEFGIRFGRYELLDPGLAREGVRGKVVIMPPYMKRSQALEDLGPCRTALLTGWAMDRNCRFRYRVDEAIPLSDHADFQELVSLVRQARPAKVYTVHGFPEFAKHLRYLGFDADHLG
jgi:Cft2 family RNA processing exonuclease